MRRSRARAATGRTRATPVDLYLLGIGIRGFRQVTSETLEVLKRCRKVLHLSGAHAELSKVNPNTENLDHIYWTAEECDRVYSQLVEFVLAEVARGPEVALVSYGHPTLFDDVSRELQRRLRRRKKRCVVLPAVSCLDTLSIDLGIDYGDGLQVMDANDLLASDLTLNPRLHTLLLQVYEFGTSTTPDAIEDRPGRFDPLVEYLQRFYPKKHGVVLVYSDDGEGKGPHLLRTRLSALDAETPRIFSGMTLYLPPLRHEVIPGPAAGSRG